jgi:hypothetical protein
LQLKWGIIIGGRMPSWWLLESRSRAVNEGCIKFVAQGTWRRLDGEAEGDGVEEDGDGGCRGGMKAEREAA